MLESNVYKQALGETALPLLVMTVTVPQPAQLSAVKGTELHARYVGSQAPCLLAVAGGSIPGNDAIECSSSYSSSVLQKLVGNTFGQGSKYTLVVKYHGILSASRRSPRSTVRRAPSVPF